MSTHHCEPLEALTAAQAGALDETAQLLGAWLFWHSRVHVLDALEHLHRRATAEGSVRRIHRPPRPGIS
ncbi:hypothetical protein AB0B50_29490 [Streptomyces sp. NPDC041068]|uniref:hypothetical protein n=1 Tax=Streptomyces sp. NPDC041068 TaxID=3155130 RepID=UPI0034045E0B